MRVLPDMLGYISTDGRGVADRILRDVADRLLAEKARIAGVVQENLEIEVEGRCDMILHELRSGKSFCISQNLGPGSTGCRLNPEALENAVGHVDAALDSDIDLLIINRFGKQEIDGRGFRPLIGRALADDVPVLVSVSPPGLDAFRAYAQDLAEPVGSRPEVILGWARAQISSRGLG